MMLISASIVLMVTTIISAVLSRIFMLNLKREAPHLREAIGPTAFAMILTRRYRKDLAEYPKSRAWASWMFALYWIQLVALVALVVAVTNK